MVVLRRIQSAGVTLNKDKCKFSMSQVSFLGHIIDETGIRADPEKTAAIHNIEPPRTIPELRRFLGMVNQLGKFSPNLAQITQPLRELLKKASIWQWTEAQQQALRRSSASLQCSASMILMLKPKYQQMLLRMDWVPYFYKSMILSGNLLHMPLVPCQTRRLIMPK